MSAEKAPTTLGFERGVAPLHRPAMGVSVANLALGNMIETFSTSTQLEAALAEALRKPT